MQSHGVFSSASASSMTIPGSQYLSPNNISKRRMSRHQSLPVPGDQFASLVKRQEAARLRKISNGLCRSASVSSTGAMGAAHGISIPGASTSSMKGTGSQAQQQQCSSSMLSSAQSSSQMSSLMQASIMQNSMMLTQMMNQRIASSNAAFRQNHMAHGHQLPQVCLQQRHVPAQLSALHPVIVHVVQSFPLASIFMHRTFGRCSKDSSHCAGCQDRHTCAYSADACRVHANSHRAVRDAIRNLGAGFIQHHDAT